MQNNFEPTSSQQYMNIVASPLIPQDCHLFLRDESASTPDESVLNLHKHYMLWFCIDGRGGIVIDNVPYTLGSGEAILITPGQPHRRKSLNGGKVQWRSVRRL